MDTSFCIEALEEALSRNEKPEIFNTDQGSQFTSEAFTGRLKENGIAISMDGKGRWRDNGLPPRLRVGSRSQNFDRPIPGVLQRRQTPFQPEGKNARPGLLQPPARIYGSLNQRTELPLSNQEKLSE